MDGEDVSKQSKFHVIHEIENCITRLVDFSLRLCLFCWRNALFSK